MSKCEINVRQQSQADVLTVHGVTPILFSGLDDTDILRRVASYHHVVIHAASGFHTCSAEALVADHGGRKTGLGSEVHFIQVRMACLQIHR
ncbi:hypothetical protein IMZ48_00815 [Candidatus Bathyarchaeota archaeon]|nr:hypothetical protein [Candidatus Bathyarchaeota archaeon]